MTLSNPLPTSVQLSFEPIGNGQQSLVSRLRADVWIVENEGPLPECYESQRLREVAAERQLRLATCKVDDFRLVSNHCNAIYYQGQRVTAPAIVLARTGAESSPRGMALLRHLEAIGSRVVNSPASIAASRCKLRTAQRLSAAGLPIPTTLKLEVGFDPVFVEQQLGMPLIVKYADGTRGEGIIQCHNIGQVEDLMAMLGNVDNRPVIGQQFVACSAGRDLRVIVVGGRVIGCMQRQSQSDGQWKANIALGGRLSLYREVTPEIEQLAVKSAEVLGLEIAGVDLLFGPNGPIVCEVNSAPDFQGVLEASGGTVDVAHSIINYISR